MLDFSIKKRLQLTNFVRFSKGGVGVGAAALGEAIKNRLRLRNTGSESVLLLRSRDILAGAKAGAAPNRTGSATLLAVLCAEVERERPDPH